VFLGKVQAITEIEDEPGFALSTRSAAAVCCEQLDSGSRVERLLYWPG
jgi:hypothetical protein